MAKKAQRNYSADASLVRGEAAMRQAGGFQPLAQAFDAPMQRLQQAAKERQAREQQRNNKVESYLSALNSNIDVTALTETDQKTVNQYLMGVKDEYAQAASAIVNFKPGTPEYMEQLDIMNGVKNSLGNLKSQLDGYQESKGNYFDSSKDQSSGNNSLQADNAYKVFTGETPFTIGTGGHLFFQGQDGTNMAYKDIKMPFKKDYKMAMQYNDLFTPIYNSGTYDSTKQKVFEDRIRAMMSSNPDGMKSIIADGLSSFGEYQDLTPLLDDPSKLKEVTEEFVKRASEAASSAAAEGKAAKEQQNPPGGNKQGAKPPTPSAIKSEFIKGQYFDAGYGYDANGNTVKYYRVANDPNSKWSTSIPAGKSKNTKPSDENSGIPEILIGPQNLPNNSSSTPPPPPDVDDAIMDAIKEENPGETDAEYKRLYDKAVNK